MPGKRDYSIAAVDRALTVLTFLAERPGLGVTEIADRLGMNKSLVFRILQTLEARGFVNRDPERSVFSLGYQMSVLGERAGNQNGLVSIARPVMDALREETGENINLLVRDGLQALVLTTREGRHSMRLFAQTGRYGPLHAGGASMLLLAYAPEEIRDAVLAGPLPRYNPSTVTDPDVLRGMLERIREQGYHISRNDFEEGAFSVAAPIRDVTGEVVASVSVAGALARLDDRRMKAHLAAVNKAAKDLSARLGHAGAGTSNAA